MRLINTTSFELHSGEQSVYREEGYAILSHRWQPSELKFNEFLDHTEELKNGAGPFPLSLDKIRGACATARDKGYHWMWIDSCCIDKSSTTEETESINSMFKWYRDSKLCIVYLSDVEVNTTLAETELKANPLIFNRIGREDPSEWFYRGWTLQEMLAPRDLEFYDIKWTYMGTRTELKVQLEKASGISQKYLTGLQDFTKVCIAAKMSWMADRVTSREEDITYSMLGIFNVFMTPQYGEGPRAFQRLQETILSSQVMDESLFAWRMPEPRHGETVNGTNEGWAPDEWGLLAPSPKWFRDCGSMTCTDELPSRIFTWTAQGIEGNFIRIMDNRKTVSMGALTGVLLGSIVCLPCGILMVVHGIRYFKKKFYGDYAFVLNCFDTNAKGETTRVNIFLRILQKSTKQQMTAFAPQIPGYRRVRCTELGTKEKASPCSSRHKAVVYQPVPQISD